MLPPVEVRAEVVVHGDLHDKNIFVDRPGLIDLDGLGLGAPEDDLANLAVHLELRNLQAGTGLAPGARSEQLYRAHRQAWTGRPLDPERLRQVEQHTWFRLACLSQYRAGSRRLVPRMLNAALTTPGP